MRKLLSYLLFMVGACFFVSHADADAVVTCTQGTYSQTVSNGVCYGVTGNTLSYSGFSGMSLQNGELEATAHAEILTLPDGTAGTFPITASATWNDTFFLPSSPAGDVLKVFVTGGGLNHPGSIEIGDINYTESDFCDAHYTGNAACSVTETMNAAGVNSLQLSGSDSVTITGPCFGNCGFSSNADLTEFVTVERFLADGTTPDPFTTLTATPEPSALALLCFAGILLFPLAVSRGVARQR